MRGYTEVLFRISIVLLACFIEEGVGRGSVSRGSRGRTVRTSGTSGSSSISSEVGTTLRIVLAVLGVVLPLIAFICYCLRKGKQLSSPRVVEHRIGELPSNSQPSNSREIRLVDLQSKNRVSKKTAPPAYSEIDQPIYNVQSEMRTTALNTSRLSPGINSQVNTATDNQ